MFDQIPSWVWWAATPIGALALFFVINRFVGWKWAAGIAGAFLAIGAARGALKRAGEEGARENEAKQRERNEELSSELNRAAEKKIEELDRTGGRVNEKDPYLRGD